MTIYLNKNNKQKSKELTYDERKKIQECIKNNLSYSQISEIMQRSPSTIKQEVAKNGNRLFYNADAAQKRSELMKKRRSEKMIINFSQMPESNDYLQLKEKIENIEEQIKIILDFIGKKND